MARTKLLVGNWKLNHTRASARDFFATVLPKLGSSSVEAAIAPVAPMLDFVANLVAGHRLALSAQNVFYEDHGAYTGEWSAMHLAELKVSYCIVGHSERRHLFSETDEIVQKKILACLRAHITPIICVGESEQERATGQTEAVIKRQVLSALVHDGLRTKDFVIAYEPVWAIGTGKTATAEDAQAIHQLIRSLVSDILGKDRALLGKILYGGSVNASNIREICRMPDIDGGLVGGASLQAASFLSMVEELHGA